MSENQPKCGTCYYWHYRPDVKPMLNANGVLSATAEIDGLGVGDCTGFPPEVHIVPVRTLKGDGLAPQSFDRQTLSNRPCCHLHQSAPVNMEVREHMDRTTGYIDQQESIGKTVAEALGALDALPIALHYPGDKDSN